MSLDKRLAQKGSTPNPYNVVANSHDAVTIKNRKAAETANKRRTAKQQSRREKEAAQRRSNIFLAIGLVVLAALIIIGIVFVANLLGVHGSGLLGQLQNVIPAATPSP